MAAGYIYILNSAALPGLLKIGGTARSPEERAKELYTTGVPSRFAIVYSVKVADWMEAERTVFEALAAFRYGSDREFFQIGTYEAITIISIIANDYLITSASDSVASAPEAKIGPGITIGRRRSNSNSSCPACGGQACNKADFAGTRLACARCGTVFVVR